MKYKDVAETLEELETYLILDGKSHEAKSYSRASEAIMRERNIPPDPARIDGVGPVIRDVIMEYQMRGSIERLEELKEKHQYYDKLRDVSGVGPKKAYKIHNSCGIETVDDLREAVESEELLSVSGIGQTTMDKIKEEL